MKQRQILVAIKLILILTLTFSCKQASLQSEHDKFTSFILNPKSSNIELFWKDEDEQVFKNIQNLKSHLEKKGRRLRFAMNGGMYEPGNRPKGLFIQNQKPLVPLDEKDGDGNFYLKPNGVFYITTDNRAVVTPTANFKDRGDVKFATQSGPMLLVDGKINEKFQENSVNLNVRNGVGMMPDGKTAFVISRHKISFYEFARYFQNLGCREALYLDGFVSKMYLPEKDFEQLDGDFAVIIGVTE